MRGAGRVRGAGFIRGMFLVLCSWCLVWGWGRNRDFFTEGREGR